MPEPSLSELLSTENYGEHGSGNPPLIDNRQLLETIGQNSKVKAENDWRKYNTFLENYKELSKDVGEIMKEPIAEKDREQIDKQAKEVLGSMFTNARDFFGKGNSVKRAEIEQNLAKLKSSTAQSKQDNLWDRANRDFVSRDPEHNTDENKKIIEDFWKQPLGQRKPYTLNMPTVLDLNALTKGLMDAKGVTKQDYSYGYSPDKSLIQELSTTTLDHDEFKKKWNLALSTGADKYGHSIRSFAEQQYEKAAKDQPAIKDQFKTVEDFWDHIGDLQFGSNKDIQIKETGKVIPNWQAKQQEQFQDRLAAMSVKFGYDKVLKAMGEGVKETFALFQQEHGMGKGSDGEALNDTVVSLIKHAQNSGQIYNKPGSTNISEGIGGGGGIEHIVNWSPPVQKLFEKDKTLGGKSVKVQPKTITVDAEGNINTYYPDASLNEIVTPDDFKVIVADKNRLTSSLEASNTTLMKQFGTPNLTGNVDGYWEERTKSAVQPAPAKNTKFSTKGLTAVKKGNKTYYADLKTNKVYDENGKEIK